MTFQSDNTVFAVARRRIELLDFGEATVAVQRNGEALGSAFDAAAARRGLLHRALGFPGRLDFRLQALQSLSVGAWEKLFGTSLLRRDVSPMRSVFACATMTAEDLLQAAHAFEAGMAAISDVA